MDLYMGIDVGTTRVKTLLLDINGQVVAQAGQDVGLSRPREGWVEQDAEELWQGVVHTSRQAIDQAGAGARVLGLSLSTQTGTLVPVDESGRPLRMAFSWMDGRGAEVMPRLLRTLDPEKMRRAGGWQFTGASVLAHIEWLRQYEPAHYAAARYFLQLNDLMIYRMTGHLCQDPSVAGYSALYDIVQNKWHAPALAAIGITPDRLPVVVPAGEPVGRLTASAAAQMGLSTETMVMNGPHDQYAAALGAGVISPGQVLLSCGTAWVVLAVNATPAWESGAAISRHAVPGRWGAIRSMGEVGRTVEWYVDTILAPHTGFARGARKEAFAIMDRQIAQVPIGARGLFCSPVAAGSTRPIAGMLWGLTAAHTKDDIGRAVLEGIAFELRTLLEDAQTAHTPVRSLVMVGGAAQSPCWPQIIADVTGLAVTVPAVQEAAARGAALLAGMGMGHWTAETGLAPADSANRTFAPSQDARQTYDKLFHDYQHMWQKFRDTLSTESSNP